MAGHPSIHDEMYCCCTLEHPRCRGCCVAKRGTFTRLPTRLHESVSLLASAEPCLHLHLAEEEEIPAAYDVCVRTGPQIVTMSRNAPGSSKDRRQDPAGSCLRRQYQSRPKCAARVCIFERGLLVMPFDSAVMPPPLRIPTPR